MGLFVELILTKMVIFYTGWWFGCHFLFSHILGIASSQLTFIFFRGVAQPPTSIAIAKRWGYLQWRKNKKWSSLHVGGWFGNPLQLLVAFPSCLKPNHPLNHHRYLFAINHPQMGVVYDWVKPTCLITLRYKSIVSTCSFNLFINHDTCCIKIRYVPSVVAFPWHFS